MAFQLSVRPEVLGGRLKNARNLKRLTQEAAANALGFARTTVVAIEAGKRQVSPEELRALAELYGVSETDLLSEGRQSLEVEVQFRSSVPRTDVDEEAVVAAMLNRLVNATLQIEELLESRVPRIDMPAFSINREEALEQQAEDAALELRQRLGLGLGPIQDLMALMEFDLGLRVFERPLPSRVSGAVVFDASVGGFVLLNSKHPMQRRRMTAAHEICHPALRKAGLAVFFSEERYEEREDKFCDAFARSFLMPATTVRKKAAELRALSGEFSVRQLLVMALYFNVSIEAMVRRMEGIGMLKQGMADRLKADGLGARHLDMVRDEMALREELPAFTPRTLLLAGVAYDKGLLSEQQIASMLELDLVTVREVLSQISEMGGDVV